MKGNITSNDQSTAVNVATTVCLVELVLSPSMIIPAMTCGWGSVSCNTLHLPSRAALPTLNSIKATAVEVLPFSTFR